VSYFPSASLRTGWLSKTPILVSLGLSKGPTTTPLNEFGSKKYGEKV